MKLRQSKHAKKVITFSRQFLQEMATNHILAFWNVIIRRSFSPKSSVPRFAISTSPAYGPISSEVR